MKRKLIDLMNQRTQHLTAAETAMNAQNQTDYETAMNAATALNEEIDRIQNLLAEQARYAAQVPMNPAEANDLAEHRAETLQNGGRITFNAHETLSALGLNLPNNATTLGTGTLVEPTRAGTQIRDRFSPICSILDQVTPVDLTGVGSLLEPYAITELTGTSGKVTNTAGMLRTDSDPVFRMAKISPYEVTVTSYIDRNISKLSPAGYEAKIRDMAMRALRKKVATLILNGDGQATPDMFGIKTAKNTLGEAIYSTHTIAAGNITVDTLMDLYFSYGGDDELGGSARLYLTKADLGVIGKLRGTNEKRRLFEIKPDGESSNNGVITDGGYIIPYTLSSALTSLSTATAGSEAIQTMLYGNPLLYELGLFGNYSIRVSEEYKAGERLLTILGDTMVGGNLVVDKSFVVATVAKV